MVGISSHIKFKNGVGYTVDTFTHSQKYCSNVSQALRRILAAQSIAARVIQNILKGTGSMCTTCGQEMSSKNPVTDGKGTLPFAGLHGHYCGIRGDRDGGAGRECRSLQRGG